MRNVREASLVKESCIDRDITVSKNIEYVARAQAADIERKFSHLYERAEIIARLIKEKAQSSDIMDALVSFDGASEIYEDMKGDEGDFRKYFAAVNLPYADCLGSNIKREDSLYICAAIAAFDKKKYEKEDIVRWIGGESGGIAAGDKRISFVRGGQSNRAFERFASLVPGVLSEYEGSFASACESVCAGESDFAVVPLENTNDGRLNSFYGLIEKYDLSIVLSTYVSSEDGESSTKFALLSRELGIIDTEGELLFECKINLASQRELGNIIAASDFFGAGIKRIFSIPASAGGRENSFDIIFSLENSDFAGLFAYLSLEYPQFSPYGVYIAAGESEE